MRKSCLSSTFLAAAGVVAACSTTAREETQSTTATATATAGPTGGPTTTVTGGTAGGGTAGGGSTTEPKFDVGESGETAAGDDGGSMGCKKVDFLFVIDNSGSMAEEQAALIASFPKFIEAIKTTLDMAQDYHIMVVDTDAWVYAGCEMICPVFGSCVVAPEYVCGMTQPELCEDVLGAGVVYPKGAGSTNTFCDFSSGARYIDTTEQDLVGKFSCAAKVGTGSTLDPEKPMEAMVNAVSGMGEVGMCNEGFLRDDAILVVTFITDENDDAGDGSNGTVEGWRQALIAAKNGDESAIVVLGLFGDQDLPNPVCPPGDPNNGGVAEPSPRLREFVDSWGERGFFGSICESSYDSFFLEAVGIIDTTCDDFVPPQG